MFDLKKFEIFYAFKFFYRIQSKMITFSIIFSLVIL